jgi:putative membrane protein
MSAALSTVASTVVMHPHGPWGFGWWFLLIPLFWIALIAILFAVFGRRWRRAAVENGYGPHGYRSPARQAEATLAERFAKGDIDEIEYRARLEVIRANSTP